MTILMMARFMRGGNMNCPGLGLAGREPVVGCLDPVIGAITNHMRERIANELDELPIKLRIGTGSNEFDLFAEIARPIRAQARGRLEKSRPIGCILARMTASWRSLVNDDSRCSGTLIGSSARRRVTSSS